MASAIIDIQCILGLNFKYLIKEMSILDVNNRGSQHYIFKHNETPCTAKSKAVNMWLYRNYHQLSLGCGDVEYSQIDRILKSLHFKCVYVKGAEKRKIIQDFIPEVDVIDLGVDHDCPRLNQLDRLYMSSTDDNYYDDNTDNNSINYNINYSHNRVENYDLGSPCCIYHMDLDRTQCTYHRVYALRRWLVNNS